VLRVHPIVVFMRAYYLVHLHGDRPIVFTQNGIHREFARPLWQARARSGKGVDKRVSVTTNGCAGWYPQDGTGVLF